MPTSTDRRKFLQLGLYLGSIWVLIAYLGCRAKREVPNFTSCHDFSQLTEDDLQIRKRFGYVESSPIEESNCRNCNLWLLPKAGVKCGGCQLFAGPVQDLGYCTYWAPIVEN